MPTYGYRCRKCGHEFEKMQKMSDPPRATCPECSGRAERQISGGAGVLFKGSGFYETDYKRPPAKDGKKDAGSGAKSDSTDAAAKPDKKDTAPAKKSEPSKGSDS